MPDPYLDDGDVRLLHGDCVKVMRELPAESVDAVVCDPPYEIAFMGRTWDSAGVAYDPETWAAALHVLKPGAHLVAFAATRTAHRITCAIEDAGFEIRDTLCWLYGSGFPKSLDVSKAIDKAAGAEREVIGQNPNARPESQPGYSLDGESRNFAVNVQPLTAPATPDAERWQGWGTALKPAYEPVILARKPLRGTVAANVLAHGVGALNIDACRIGTEEAWRADDRPYDGRNGYGPDDADGWAGNWTKRSGSHAAGRWPANVALDETAAAMLDAQTGTLSPASEYTRKTSVQAGHGGEGWGEKARGENVAAFGDRGGASRFFYTAKASRAERNTGLHHLPEREAFKMSGGENVAPGRTAASGKQVAQNHHPTVKPVALMRWLCRLVTPPGGVILDPFIGSGSTAVAARVEGFRCWGIDLDVEYLQIAAGRLSQLSLFAEDEMF